MKKWLMAGPAKVAMRVLFLALFVISLSWNIYTMITDKEIQVIQNEKTLAIEYKCRIRTQSLAITQEKSIFRPGGWDLTYPDKEKYEFSDHDARYKNGVTWFEMVWTIEDAGFIGDRQALECLQKEMLRRGYERDRRHLFSGVAFGYYQLRNGKSSGKARNL